jgi:hypothetical protein
MDDVWVRDSEEVAIQRNETDGRVAMVDKVGFERISSVQDKDDSCLDESDRME